MDIKQTSVQSSNPFAQSEKASGLNIKRSVIIACAVSLIIVSVLSGFYIINNNKKIKANYAAAQEAFRNGDLQKAEALLEGNPPRNIAKDFYNLKYNVQINQNKVSASIETALKLVKIQPKDAFSNYLAGLAYNNDGDKVNTEKYLLKAIKYEPGNVDYKMFLANLYDKSERYEDALALYKAVIKQDASYEVAWAGAANIYENIEDYENALKYRKEAAAKFSDNVHDLYKLAELYNKLGKTDLAVKYYAQTARIDINDSTDAKSKYQEITGKPYQISEDVESTGIPFEMRKGLMVVKAWANGYSGDFMIDTGANSTVIYSKFAKANGIAPSKNIRGIIQVADGSKTVVPVAEVSLKLGRSVFNKTRAFIVNDDKFFVDGIIGNDTLSKTDFYIDKENNKIIIKSVK